MTMQVEPSTLPNDAIASRAELLFHDSQLAIYRRTDRLFAVLMIIQWIGGIAAAIWISPRTWSGSQSEIHLHVLAAIFVGGAITIFPVWLALARPGFRFTRHAIAVAQMLTSALLIHLSGGRIETHFHVFGSLAFLACYRDWRVLVSATVVVAADHFLRGIYSPLSVYGVLVASNWRTFEHAAWVVFEDVFLIIAMGQSVREMKATALQQAQLEASNHKVESASRAKSEFLANMSHEIRTPMTAILGFSDLLVENLTDLENVDAAKTIKKNGEYLLAVINDILDLSKVESGKLDIEHIDCSPHKIVADVASLMRVRAKSKGLELIVEFDGAVPETIESDPTRLRQILLNIVGNAIKFTESGSVRITTRLSQIPTDHPMLEIDVTDSGMGVSEYQINRLFRPFVQGDSSTTRRFGGTGLGLTISKRLAEHLGGDIQVASTPGEGSTFSLTVCTGPLEDVQLIGSSEESSVPPGESDQESATGYETLDCRVLLAEDGPDNQRLISVLLEKAGAHVEVADNGQEAVDRALAARDENRAFDVVLMDMQMPILDGYEATSRLRETGYIGSIVALTAHAMAEDRQRCLDVGCDDYTTKPVNRKKLISLVAEHSAQRTPAEARRLKS